jgi:heme/copper-type cytochrome/quinol oxidase subunit 3
MPLNQTIQRPTAATRLALRFILVSAGVYVTAGGLALALIQFLPAQVTPGKIVFPRALGLTTLLLALGSGGLHRAVTCVRRERQIPFRRSLLFALVTGTLFVGIQSYGLSCLFQNQLADDVQTGSNAFVAIMVALHAMHFGLALMFLVWVTLGALADRYDHEYFWGVSLCAWFWHALGIVWVCILIVFVISTGIAKDMGRQDSAPTRGVARLPLRSSVPVHDLIHFESAAAAQ